MTDAWRGLFVGIALALVSVTAAAVDPGVAAPEAAGIVLNGSEDQARVSALKGRVLVVEFWASWCGPCVESMPRLDQLRTELHGAGYADRFEVLAVGLDNTVDRARRFLDLHPVAFPVVVDTIGIASRNYGVWRLPATFLVAPDGHINQIYHGYGPEFSADLRARVMALLRAGPDAVQSKPGTLPVQSSTGAGNP
jgi:thiol-disulfide isomerase/thioredoxin